MQPQFLGMYVPADGGKEGDNLHMCFLVNALNLAPSSSMSVFATGCTAINQNIMSSNWKFLQRDVICTHIKGAWVCPLGMFVTKRDCMNVLWVCAGSAFMCIMAHRQWAPSRQI